MTKSLNTTGRVTGSIMLAALLYSAAVRAGQEKATEKPASSDSHKHVDDPTGKDGGSTPKPTEKELLEKEFDRIRGEQQAQRENQAHVHHSIELEFPQRNIDLGPPNSQAQRNLDKNIQRARERESGQQMIVAKNPDRAIPPSNERQKEQFSSVSGQNLREGGNMKERQNPAAKPADKPNPGNAAPSSASTKILGEGLPFGSQAWLNAVEAELGYDPTSEETYGILAPSWEAPENANAELARSMIQDKIVDMLKESIKDPALKGVLTGAKAGVEPSSAVQDVAMKVALNLIGKVAPKAASLLGRAAPVILGIFTPQQELGPAGFDDHPPRGPEPGTPEHRQFQLTRKWIEHTIATHPLSSLPEIDPHPELPQLKPSH